MSTRVPSRHRFQRSGFTLLEVILATMIVGMLTLTLYRFVSAHLTVIRQSTDISDEREAIQGVVRLVQTQLRSIDPQEQEALLGEPYKFRGVSNDEIAWHSTAGAGLLTNAAAGQYRVTLTVQPVSDRSTETELGLRRQPIVTNDATVTGLNRGGGAAAKYNWLPLIRPMAALEVRYYDPAQKLWVDTWKDASRRPSLVRLRLWKYADQPPVEAVVPVPSAT